MSASNLPISSQVAALLSLNVSSGVLCTLGTTFLIPVTKCLVQNKHRCVSQMQKMLSEESNKNKTNKKPSMQTSQTAHTYWHNTDETYRSHQPSCGTHLRKWSLSHSRHHYHYHHRCCCYHYHHAEVNDDADGEMGGWHRRCCRLRSGRCGDDGAGEDYSVCYYCLGCCSWQQNCRYRGCCWSSGWVDAFHL